MLQYVINAGLLLSESAVNIYLIAYFIKESAFGIGDFYVRYGHI